MEEFLIEYLKIIKMENILELFELDFFQNAIFASVLCGIICGIIGTYIVAKRIVFISGGISHASFGGIGIAYYLGFTPMLGASIFAILSAIGITKFSKINNLRQDSIIGIFWSAGMAIGLLFIYISPGYVPNLMSYLFGNILSTSNTQLLLMLGLTIFIIAFFCIFMRPIYYIAFDKDYAQTNNKYSDILNTILICLVALSIVITINVIGIILSIAYLTIPQATANLFYNDFKKITLASSIICPIGSLCGLIIASIIDLPPSASIILTFFLFFILAYLYKKIYTTRLKRTKSI